MFSIENISAKIEDSDKILGDLVEPTNLKKYYSIKSVAG